MCVGGLALAQRNKQVWMEAAGQLGLVELDALAAVHVSGNSAC
jgi:hypothetical protein